MGNSLKVALALGVGYFLGRSHKTRLAFILAVGAATGGFGGVAKRVVTSGGKRLAASESLSKLSPEFGNVVDSLKGDLAEAGKAAAKAAITNRLDAVADSIHDRTETLRGQAVAPDEAYSAAPGSSADGEPAGRRTEDGGPERHAEHRRRPEGGRTSDRDRPQRPPRQRPSDESSAGRQPAQSRAGRPAPDHRGGGD